MTRARKPTTGHPARQPQARRRSGDVPPEEAFGAALLGLVQAGLHTTRESETRIHRTIRQGGNPTEELEVHDQLRAGVLGLLTAYSLHAGLPDPRTIHQEESTPA